MSLTYESAFREGCLAGLLRAKEVLEGKVDEPTMALLDEAIAKEKSTDLYEDQSICDDWDSCENCPRFEECSRCEEDDGGGV